MDEVAEAVNRTIERLLPETDLAEAPLYEAMRHGTLGGGKRLRPFLCMQSASLFNVPTSRSRRVAAALEFVHCYSLIHDDLPAMDDAALRRGQPTVHKQFDEATAILAGDALLTLAFEVLADPETHPDPFVQTELVRTLAIAAGGHGMCGGQMLDLIAERDDVDFDVGEISRLQRMKTGKLMAFACEAGAAKRSVMTLSISVSPSKSRMIFSMSKPTRRIPAKTPAKTPMPAKRHLFLLLGKTPPAPARK